MSEFPLQVTLKPPATAASAPWLNFQAQDQAELEGQLREAFPTVEADTLSELVAKAYLEYAAVLTAAFGLAAPAAPTTASIQSPGPAPQWAAPAAPAIPAANAGPPAPQCPHGERKYLESKPGAPKPWKAWMCSAEKDNPSKCSPQWIR